jgi:hypothetical protein
MQAVIYGFQLEGNEGGFANTSEFSLGTITESSSPTPEPSTGVLLLLGFAGVGFAGYRRMRKPVSIAA